MRFKIKKTTPLRKLMHVCCSRLGPQASKVRFMADDERIAPDDTPDNFGLKEESEVSSSFSSASAVVTK